MNLNRICHALALTFFATCGCSGKPGRVALPDVDADSAAEAAMGEFDENADSQLDEKELAACPPLVDAMPTYDGNRDGTLTHAELVGGIGTWSERKIGAFPLQFTIRMDGRPFAGAKVSLKPVEFLGDAVKPAAGEADGAGAGSLSFSASDRPEDLPPNLPLIQPGLYRVEITHPTVNVPSQYNDASTLGLEAAVAGQKPAGVTWELRSK
ncbi:MAG: hypothetical protein H0T51_02215 [Pirellulales bacterium]|nr:hypothetical protein [Pirellulales bacterium]